MLPPKYFGKNARQASLAQLVSCASLIRKMSVVQVHEEAPNMLAVAELVDAPGRGPGTHRVCMFKSCRSTHVSLAQLEEHRTFNPQVARSSRAGDTIMSFSTN